MQDRGASLTGRTSKLTFAVKASCLAKERCIPETDNSEKICTFLEKSYFKRNEGFAYITFGKKNALLGDFDYSGVKSQSSF
jgi:hypothetical protein